MPTNQEIEPREISLARTPDGSRILVGYRDAALNTITIALSADMVRRTLEELLRCAASVGNPAMAAAVQTISIREIHAIVEQGIANLRYELEAGIRLQSTIGFDAALQMADELAKARPVSDQSH